MDAVLKQWGNHEKSLSKHPKRVKELWQITCHADHKEEINQMNKTSVYGIRIII